MGRLEMLARMIELNRRSHDLHNLAQSQHEDMPIGPNGSDRRS